MKGYSATELFTPREIATWLHARRLVDALPETWPGARSVQEALAHPTSRAPVNRRPLRCHELACAVAHRIGDGFRRAEAAPWSGSFVVVDGKYGPVDHSWIEWSASGRRRILDVYAVGRLPMVELIDVSGVLVHQAAPYVARESRTDFRAADVEALLAFWKEQCL